MRRARGGVACVSVVPGGPRLSAVLSVRRCHLPTRVPPEDCVKPACQGGYDGSGSGAGQAGRPSSA